MPSSFEHHARRPEVGALHPGVLAQLGRRAFGDDLAPVDDRDAVGQAEQELHVVLDHDDGERALQLGDELGEARRALGAQAGGGLVQEQQPRLARRAPRAISSARRSP